MSSMDRPMPGRPVSRRSSHGHTGHHHISFDTDGRDASALLVPLPVNGRAQPGDNLSDNSKPNIHCSSDNSSRPTSCSLSDNNLKPRCDHGSPAAAGATAHGSARDRGVIDREISHADEDEEDRSNSPRSAGSARDRGVIDREISHADEDEEDRSDSPRSAGSATDRGVVVGKRGVLPDKRLAFLGTRESRESFRGRIRARGDDAWFLNLDAQGRAKMTTIPPPDAESCGPSVGDFLIQTHYYDKEEYVSLWAQRSRHYMAYDLATDRVVRLNPIQGQTLMATESAHHCHGDGVSSSPRCSSSSCSLSSSSEAVPAPPSVNCLFKMTGSTYKKFTPINHPNKYLSFSRKDGQLLTETKPKDGQLLTTRDSYAGFFSLFANHAKICHNICKCTKKSSWPRIISKAFLCVNTRKLTSIVR